MFSNIFSKLNLSSPIQVDTRLHDSTLRQGDLLTGEVHLKTKEDAQVEYIQLQLCVTYRDEEYTKELSYHVHTIEDSFMLWASQGVVSIPFEFILPPDSPISSKHSRIFIRTKVKSNKNGLFEKTDTDYLNVCPQNTFQHILDRVEQKGFRLKEIEIEMDPYGKKTTIVGRNFLQEFDFEPNRFSHHAGKMSEIEVALLDSDNQGNIVVLFSVEKYAQTFSEMFSNPEKKWIVEVAANQPAHYYEQIVQNALDRFIY